MYGYSTSMFLINSFVYSSAPPVETEFKITVDTTKAGSASDTFILPLHSGTTSMIIYWGDGNSDVITTFNQAELSHTYASSGTYQISCDGSFTGVFFNFGGDRLKVLSIDNWGNNQWSNFRASFYACLNLTANYTDAPDTSNVLNFEKAFGYCYLFNGALNIDTSSATTMQEMFRNCTIFNQPLLFDTSSCTNFLVMFYLAPQFNQDLSSWNISSLTTATSMFLNSGFSTTNYDLLLPAWDAYGTSSVPFHAGTAQYSSGAPATAHANMISRGWTITDGGAV